MCMAFLIVYSVAIIPYRICFSMEATGIFLFLDRCIDVLFTVDMLLTFRKLHHRPLLLVPTPHCTSVLTNRFMHLFITVQERLILLVLINYSLRYPNKYRTIIYKHGLQLIFYLLFRSIQLYWKS